MFWASFCFKLNVCWLKLFACLCYQIKSLLSFVPNCRLYICLFLLFLSNNVTWQVWYLGLVACYLFLHEQYLNFQYLYLRNGMYSVSTFFSGRFSWLKMIAFLWTFTPCELIFSAEKPSCASSCHHFCFSLLVAFYIFSDDIWL